MNIRTLLLRASIGLILLAIIDSFATWNVSNLWVPISSLLLILSLLVYVIRSSFALIEERLRQIEEQVKKQQK